MTMKLRGFLWGMFWFFYGTAFWGSFEQALQGPSHPIWSGTWGFPIPHHYIVGFIGMAINILGIAFYKKTKRNE